MDDDQCDGCRRYVGTWLTLLLGAVDFHFCCWICLTGFVEAVESAGAP